MCVLTYLPTAAGFVLTNNRDEHLSRPRALAPKRYCLHHREAFFPKDPQAGGTWLATSRQYTVCLLNGAFLAHHPQPPYRHSRGEVILDFFGYANAAAFAEGYDFSNLEPFTLVVIESDESLKMMELRWDGTHLFQTEKDAQAPHIWSSVTLYPPPVVAAREGWFGDWQRQHPDFGAEAIWDFHHNGGTGDRRNDLVMARPNGIQTFSVMQVEKTGDSLRFTYQDLQAGETTRYWVV